jgi:hypothetical protein
MRFRAAGAGAGVRAPAALAAAGLALATLITGLALNGRAQAQSPPACQSNTGVTIDQPKLIAYQRTGIIKVFAATPEAQATGVLTIRAKDAGHPIAHPAAVPYSQLATQGGNRRYRFKAEKGDGDAVVALTWTKTENGTTCRAQRSETITINKGKRPFISIGHERSPRIIFGHESPDCVQTRVLSWKVEVKGPGGRVRELVSDVCGKNWHRKGSNAHFTLTARSGVVVFRARRPHGEYKATYRVVVGGKLAVHGGLRAIVRRGEVIVVISIRRP